MLLLLLLLLVGRKKSKINEAQAQCNQWLKPEAQSANNNTTGPKTRITTPTTCQTTRPLYTD